LPEKSTSANAQQLLAKGSLKMNTFWVILAVAAAIVVYAIALYNNLVGLRNRVKNGFSQIDVQLTRRYDLIPNLVETVKGYLKHERETLEGVIQARNAALTGLKSAAADPSDPEAIRQLGSAEAALGGCTRTSVCAGRGLPRSQVQPEHDAVSGRTCHDRKQSRLRTPGIQ
jgi:hypothetical protein